MSCKATFQTHSLDQTFCKLQGTRHGFTFKPFCLSFQLFPFSLLNALREGHGILFQTPSITGLFSSFIFLFFHFFKKLFAESQASYSLFATWVPLLAPYFLCYKREYLHSHKAAPSFCSGTLSRHKSLAFFPTLTHLGRCIISCLLSFQFFFVLWHFRSRCTDVLRLYSLLKRPYLNPACLYKSFPVSFSLFICKKT